MILAILQARLSSTRYPGKVLKTILGRPMLELQIERIRRATSVNRILVATSTDPSDDPIEAFCKNIGIDCFRGNLENVLDRFYQAALPLQPDHVVRLTGDCPLLDPTVIDGVVQQHLFENNDYTATRGFPDGLDTEAMKFSALASAWKSAKASAEAEHVTYYIYSHPEKFKIGSYWNSEDRSALRWTVDYQVDFEVVTEVYKALYSKNNSFGYLEILDFFDRHPELVERNRHITNNEGLAWSIAKDAKIQPT